LRGDVWTLTKSPEGRDVMPSADPFGKCQQDGDLLLQEQSRDRTRTADTADER